MKTDGAYLVLVKRPEDTNWILHTDSDGVEYDLAVECLRKCVRMYGKDQVIISKRMYYKAEVDVCPIGMEDAK